MKGWQLMPPQPLLSALNGPPNRFATARPPPPAFPRRVENCPKGGGGAGVTPAPLHAHPPSPGAGPLLSLPFLSGGEGGCGQSGSGSGSPT